MIIGCGGGGGGGTNTPASEQIPSALISSPTGTIFNEGENIAFSGTGTDNQDGPLDGSALTWRSNIDGDIGTGSTLTTSVLSAGPHEITLKAIDSDSNEYITAPTIINVEQTRFIKMGTQTTGVPDASNAFDGDDGTAATIMTPDTEFIHFKAYIGGADTFLFKIKLGASTSGSRIAIQGLYAGDATWRPIMDIGLDAETTPVIRVTKSQDYKDAQGYINLRARWEGGGGGDVASLFEIWRVDPIHPGPQTTTTSTTNVDLAFDGNPSTSATITSPWDGSAPFLHFKAYVGIDTANPFSFNISHNSIGPAQSLVIEIEDLATPASVNWIHLGTFGLDTNNTRKVTVSNVQNYLDADGYISMRAFWVGFGASQMEIYEISRLDPFFMGPKTSFGWIESPEAALDNDPDSYAIMHHYWGQNDLYHFLHVKAYVSDASAFAFSLQIGPSTPGDLSELIVEGEGEPDQWVTPAIERIIVDANKLRTIKLLNARQYVNADGCISLRVRWVSDSPDPDHDQNAYIYNIQREPTK